MAAETALLDLVTPTQGTLSGTWGNTVNNGITEYVDIAIAGTLSLTGDGAVDLVNSIGNATQTNITAGSTLAGAGTATAQFAVVKVSGTTTTKTVTGPSTSKTYIVDNTGSFTVTFKASGQSGVSVIAGEKCTVYFNGSDYVKVATSTGTGSVTAVSVVSANGLAGTSSGGATPALTLSTSITGVLKGNGTAISAATAGTDYLAPPSGTAILKANSGGALANATAGTDYLAPPSGTALLKANSGGALANATAGTDYVAPGTATTFTATQTFSGTSSATAIVLNDAAEIATVSATAATGTIAYDITTQSVLYYTTSASANWTVNFRGSSGTSLDTLMTTGQSMTVAFLVTQGSTAYYNSSVQIDGTTSGVTIRWLGGAPTAGNASGIDSYRYLIIKTGSATFTVLASNTQFKA
jgi:hypothetical protein